MDSRTTSSLACFQNLTKMLHPSFEDTGDGGSHCHRVNCEEFNPIKEGGSANSQPITTTLSPSLLYNLSVLQDKVHQVQSLATLLISANQAPPEPASMVMVSSMENLFQEIIFTASSMMFTCEQMARTGNSSVNYQLGGLSSYNWSSNINNHLSVDDADQAEGSLLYPENRFDWITDPPINALSMPISNNNNNHIVNPSNSNRKKATSRSKRGSHAISPATGGCDRSNTSNSDIIELDVSELLVKYTHYCPICGKGFKRDANLRMHMRAHGDECKSSSALSNPLKKRIGIDPKGNIVNIDSAEHANDNPLSKVPRKYSCPHEGCRWNQRHAKFLPLKSMICVKNHYKRSHCPKMYVCKQCNTKQFSVLSDLRTHEKHCGDIKWQCSCGTTFSRKDKLMGHVMLFTGHSPMINLTKPSSAEKVDQWSTSSMQISNM